MMRSIDVLCGLASVRPNHDQENNYGVTATLVLTDERLENLYFELKAMYDDPTPWCHVCSSMTQAGCNCGDRADND